MNILLSIRSHAVLWPGVVMIACSPSVDLGSNADAGSAVISNTTGPTGAGTGGTAGTSGATGTSGSAGAAAGTGGASGTGGAADSGNAATAHVFPACATDLNPLPDEPCAPSGFPFAQYAYPYSTCTDCFGPNGTVRLSQPKPGTLCLSGSVAKDAGFGVGFTVFSSDMLNQHYQKVLNDYFNADDHGIAKVTLTIDNPPPTGVQVGAYSIHSKECHDLDCLSPGGSLPGSVHDSGQAITAFLTDFALDKATDAGQHVDTHALSALTFWVGPGTIDFCVRDFHFLDANGMEVKP